MENFATWEWLASFAGATAATAVVTQFVKGFLPQKVSTQLTTYFIALAILTLGHWFGSPMNNDAQLVLYCLLNAVPVCLAAQGGFNATKKLFVKNEEIYDDTVS